MAAMAQASSSGRPFHGEVLNRAQDFREVWVAIEIQPLRDAQGAVEGFMRSNSISPSATFRP